MHELVAQRCPLCTTTARYAFVNGHARKHFYCAHCGSFQVTYAAEVVLSTLPTYVRHALSEKTQSTTPDHVLIIAIPPVMTDVEGAADLLSTEYAPKARLPFSSPGSHPALL